MTRTMVASSLPIYTNPNRTHDAARGIGWTLTCRGEKRCGGEFTIYDRYLNRQRSQPHPSAGAVISVPCPYCFKPSWLPLPNENP